MGYAKPTSIPLFVAEILNILASVLFLIFFVRRYRHLRTHSVTYRFKHHFPKKIVLLGGCYIILSISLLVYNIVTASYTPEHWYQYLLQGGGGECIDALVLLFQINVLKYQIDKEQPYTRLHFVFFVYIGIMELIRFIFTLMDVLNNDNDVVTLVICSLIFLDVLIEGIYWKVLRNSLPEFIDPTDVEIDDLNYHTRMIQSRNQKSFYVKGNNKFPYINTFVCYQQGLFKIVVERAVFTQAEYRSTNVSDRRRQSSRKEIMEVEESLLTISNGVGKKLLLEKEILCAELFTLGQIKKLYAISGRYPLKREYVFEEMELYKLIQEVQELLNDVFEDERRYDQELLMFLGVAFEVAKEYEDFLVKAEARSSEDRVIGKIVPEDTNSGFFSIVGYKTLWNGDHFYYYFKVMSNKGDTAYLYRQGQDFQQFFTNLKKGVKLDSKRIVLPSIQKKVVRKGMCEESMDMLEHYENFLRLVCNDHQLLEGEVTGPLVRQFLEMEGIDMEQGRFCKQFFLGLKIEPKSYFFTLKKEESVTMFEFKLTKGKQLVKSISCEEQSVLELFEEVNRWLKNNEYPYRPSLELAKRDKKEMKLFKIGKYLQQVVMIRHVFKIYSVCSFFDIKNSRKSIVKFKCKVKAEVKDRYSFGSVQSQQSRSESNPLGVQSPTMQRMVEPPSYLSNRISDVLNDLGNQSLD